MNNLSSFARLLFVLNGWVICQVGFICYSEGSGIFFLLLVIIFVIIFLTVHLMLQSIVSPQACLNLQPS